MGLETIVFWIVMTFISVQLSLMYDGPGDDIDEYISERQKQKNDLHIVPLVFEFPTGKLNHGSEHRDLLVEAIKGRNDSIAEIVNDLINPLNMGIFLENLNASVDIGRLYLIDQLFDQRLLKYVYSGIDYETGVPFENMHDLAIASHRAYSVFAHVGIAVAKIDPLSLPFHYFDSLGWKIRTLDNLIYAEFIPSDWY